MEIDKLTLGQLLELEEKIKTRKLVLNGLNAEEIRLLMRNFNCEENVGPFSYSWYFPDWVSVIRAFRARTGADLMVAKTVVVGKMSAIMDCILPYVIRM